MNRATQARESMLKEQQQTAAEEVAKAKAIAHEHEGKGSGSAAGETPTKGKELPRD